MTNFENRKWGSRGAAMLMASAMVVTVGCSAMPSGIPGGNMMQEQLLKKQFASFAKEIGFTADLAFGPQEITSPPAAVVGVKLFNDNVQKATILTLKMNQKLLGATGRADILKTQLSEQEAAELSPQEAMAVALKQTKEVQQLLEEFTESGAVLNRAQWVEFGKAFIYSPAVILRDKNAQGWAQNLAGFMQNHFDYENPAHVEWAVAAKDDLAEMKEVAPLLTEHATIGVLVAKYFQTIASTHDIQLPSEEEALAMIDPEASAAAIEVEGGDEFEE